MKPISPCECGGRTSSTARVTTTAPAPLAPSPSSISVFRRRRWMLSMVFLQLMKRSKFCFTCSGAMEVLGLKL